MIDKVGTNPQVYFAKNIADQYEKSSSISSSSGKKDTMELAKSRSWGQWGWHILAKIFSLITCGLFCRDNEDLIALEKKVIEYLKYNVLPILQDKASSMAEKVKCFEKLEDSYPKLLNEIAKKLTENTRIIIEKAFSDENEKSKWIEKWNKDEKEKILKGNLDQIKSFMPEKIERYICLIEEEHKKAADVK